MSVLFTTCAIAQTGLIQPTEEDEASTAIAGNQTESLDNDEISEEATFTINFREADILEVLEAYSNLLNINIVPGEGVSGVVTVISPGPVTRLQAINLLHSILKHRGFAVIENDGYISVVQDAIAELSGFPIFEPDMPDETDKEDKGCSPSPRHRQDGSGVGAPGRGASADESRGRRRGPLSS